MITRSMSIWTYHLLSRLRSSHTAGPDFICLGMQKAGTRWLYDQLNARNDVWMPPIKELDFLLGGKLPPRNLEAITKGKGSLPVYPHYDDDKRRSRFLAAYKEFDRHTLNFRWYRWLFRLKDDRKSGDISPNYSRVSSLVAAKTVGELPRCRVIIFLRDPVDRLWSAMCQHVRKQTFLESEITDWSTLKPLLEHPLVEPLSYPSQLWQTWSSVLPQDRLRFWFFEDIKYRPFETLDEICEYLDIDGGTGGLPADFNRKRNNPKVPMPPEIEKLLSLHFMTEYERCSQTFGGHAKLWLERAKNRTT
jgi:hypothetical protein